jgi:hypothetical protein
MVHYIGSQSALRLYWTTSRKTLRAKEPYLAENFKLPLLFWSDLVEVLRLSVFSEQTGKNQPLEEAATIYHEILQRKEWTSKHMPLNWAMAQNGLSVAGRDYLDGRLRGGC